VAPLAGALASSLLLILAFPGPDVGWLSALALIPLIGVVRHLGAKRAFLYGWMTGFVWLFVSYNWISQTLSRYGDFPFPLNQLAIVIIASVYALYVGVFAAAVPMSNRMKGLTQALYIASAWVLLEYLRSVFLIVVVNVLIWNSLGAIFSGDHRKALRMVCILAILCAAVITTGLLALPDPGGQKTTVAVVQGNFAQEVKWQESVREEALETYVEMTDKAVAAGVQLAVWPETAMPFYFQAEEELAARLTDFVREKGIHLIFGSPAFTVKQGDIRLYNSAYHIGPGDQKERYDKVLLVPFGEYVPFSRIVPFLARLVPGEGEFSTGGLQEPFRTPFKTGTLICFEVTFPHLSRRQVLQGAQILVNITNDGWFGSTWGPYQHLAVSAVRAAENGVPVIRAANTGISAVFDARGRLITSIGLLERGVLISEITVGGKRTIYNRTGNWIIYFATVVLLISSLLNLISRRKEKWTILMNSDRQ